MKILLQFRVAAVCALFLAAGGCNKKEEVPVTTTEGQTGVVENAMSTAAAQTEAMKEAAHGAATEAKTQMAAAGDKVSGVIDQAKKLIGENKLNEATKLLDGLVGQQLTPEQQSLVQSLREQIQKALDSAKAGLTNEAAKAAGGLLQTK